MNPGASDERVVWGVGTARTMRAHWALAELGVDYRTEPLRTRTPDMDRPAFRALSPQGKIPVLCDGELVLTESAAIVAYLGERYGDPERRVIPVDAIGRARYQEWASYICMELDATSLYVLRRHEQLSAIYGEAPAAVESSRAYFARMIDAVAGVMDDGREYLMGERFSGVDILMMTCLDWAVDYGRTLPPVFRDLRERLSARPAYRRALEANRTQ